MNVYDFDQTVFQPDSSYCFVMYCLRHYPRAVLHCLPGVSYTGIQALRKQAETKELKEQVFSFLPRDCAEPSNAPYDILKGLPVRVNGIRARRSPVPSRRRWRCRDPQDLREYERRHDSGRHRWPSGCHSSSARRDICK